MRFLHLTTPHMGTGAHPAIHADVVAAQRALGHNRFGGFAPGMIDGEYGPATEAATHRAQLALGFRKASCNGVYGPGLHAVLTGGPLSKAQVVRRKARLAAATVTRRAPTLKAMRWRALSLAAHELGEREAPPNSNMQKYGSWYHMNGAAWCAIFGSWCLTLAGFDFHYAYCPFVLADARARRNGLSIVGTPVPGDIALYGFGGSTPVHFGLVRTVPNAGGLFAAIEGNTSYGNDANGGEVMLRTRKRSDVVAFVRVSKRRSFLARVTGR